jgi:hypothetical protein
MPDLTAPLEIIEGGVPRRATAADFTGPAGPAGPAGPPGAPGSGAAIQAAGVDMPQRAKLNFTGSLTVADDAANDRTNVTVDISGLATVAALTAETSARAAADAALVSLVPATAARNTIQPTADVVPLTLKGAVGQTANLQQWQDSTGAMLTKIPSGGGLTTGANLWTTGGAVIASAGDVNAQNSAATRVSIGNVGPSSASGIVLQNNELALWRSASGVATLQTQAAAPTTLVVKGTASQSTTNLQEWKLSDASNALIVNSQGDMIFGNNRLAIVGQGNAAPAPRSALTAGVMIAGAEAARTVVVVRGVASQTANLEEWQDSTGAAVAKLNPNGTLAANGLAWPGYTTGSVVGLQMNRSGYNAFFENSNANNVGLAIRSAASQAVNIQEWQDSAGSAVVSINPSGQIIGNSGGWFTGTGDPVVRAIAGDQFRRPLVVKGAASQSANLTEWQDSTAAVLAKVDSNGNVISAAQVQAAKGLATQVGIGAVGPASESGISFQNGEMSLYRSSSTVLATSNAMLIVKKGTPDEIRLGSGGLIQMGASGDVNLQRDAAGSMTLFGGSARARFIVKGFSGQTDNLQEWQDSGAAIKASVNSIGEITGASLFGGRVEANRSTSVQVSVGYDGSANAATVAWGQSRDVQLRRLAAGVLTLYASGTLPTAPTMTGAGLVIQDVTTAPSTNPVGGGVLYGEAGALKWRGTAGTITQLAAA